MQLARQLLTPRQPALIITHGLPGSGKSTFSQTALAQLGAMRIRSDVERKRLFGLPALTHSRGMGNVNIYSAKATQRTYAHLLKTTRSLLVAGHNVIVDAAFLKQEERELFRRLALSTQAHFTIVSLQASQITLRARILKRQALHKDPSEADLEVLEKLSAMQEALFPHERAYTYLFHTDTDKEFSWASLKKFIAES